MALGYGEPNNLGTKLECGAPHSGRRGLDVSEEAAVVSLASGNIANSRRIDKINIWKEMETYLTERHINRSRSP